MAGFIVAATERDVDAPGQFDRAAWIDQRLVRHRPDHAVVGGEVDERTVAAAGDAVHAGDHQPGAAAGVMRARGAGPRARM